MQNNYDVLKGSMVVGHVTIAPPDNKYNGLCIGSLVGVKACDQAHIDPLGIVEDYDINWDCLDDDPVLDDQPWGLKP